MEAKESKFHRESARLSLQIPQICNFFVTTAEVKELEKLNSFVNRQKTKDKMKA
jgi:hypothetical protein